MKDASTGRHVLEADEASLSADSDGTAQDGDADPQARDERPIIIGSEEHTEEPSRADIEEWREAYKENPLIRVPIQNFSSDVTEPGVSVVVPADEVPTVPEDYWDDTYVGKDLDDALEHWLANCYIDGWDFDADISDLLDAVVKDRRGRRGTAIVEHAYDDATERERILGLRPIKVETMTAYTREGKRIVLRPDDDVDDFDSVAVQDLGDNSRDHAPTTPAGHTAALSQYDDVYGTTERDEIPFALSDVTVSAYDPDTGELFGQPDSAGVVDRAQAVYEKFDHIDQAVLNQAFANIIAKVETDDEKLAKRLRDDLDVNSPQTVSGTNVPVELEQVEGSVPDAVAQIQQEIEYVLTAMPTPLYRVGFAGDINRDITGEQREDYRDQVKRERARLEADFATVLELKAREFLHGDAHGDQQLDVTPQLRIRPADAESPLRDEEFDADAFNTLMQALSTAAGPKGGADAMIPKEKIIDKFLEMDPDELLGGDADLSGLDESDPRVREAFDKFTGASLAAPSDSPDDNHIFGPATNGVSYRLEADEAYCEIEGEQFDQFDEADIDESGRRLCPYCGDQLQEYDKVHNAHLEDDGVHFGNVGGDPFHDQDVLESFLDDLDDAADGEVLIGKTEWPADDYTLHDHPVTATGIGMSEAADIWESYSDKTGALMSPRSLAELGRRYSPGDDLVRTPDGIGLVVDVVTESHSFDEDGVPDEIEASSESPTYVVTLADEEQTVGFYKASDLAATETSIDADPLAMVSDDEAAMGCDAELGDWEPPESWKEADIPARVIGLDALQSMGGDFEGCESEMAGSVATPDQFCGAFLDWIFGGYDYWRGDSFLPGD